MATAGSAQGGVPQQHGYTGLRGDTSGMGSGYTGLRDTSGTGYAGLRDTSGPGSYGMMQQSPVPAPQMMSPTKDLNAVSMCRVGKEVVHDIVTRAQEVFQLLGPKSMQLPNNVTFHGQQYHERKAKVEEQLRQINMNFRKLRLYYSKINEIVETTDLPSEQELVPFVGKEVDTSEKDYSDIYHYTSEQHREMVEAVKLKNQQLKEIIDSIRTIIWEINTMITMRKT